MSIFTGLAERFRALLNTAIGVSLPYIMRYELRTKLRGVYLKNEMPELPDGGFILAANHHSWWDGYAVWLLSRHLKRTVSGLMERRQLERFPFFRAVGMVADHELRTAMRRLERGDMLLVFPEAALRAPGEVEEVKEGIFFLTRVSGAPVIPLAVRCAVRGAQRPELLLAFGEALAADARHADYIEAVNRLLDMLDRNVRTAHPERPLPGFITLSSGAGNTDERTGRLSRWWQS